MKKLLTHGSKFAGSALLTCMAGAYGQSLGEPAAELWIGMPLEVTIPARFASADSRDTCVHAEVSYGGTRLAPSHVRVTVLGTAEHRRVRVTSDLVVDEPMVTVSLRAGCTGTFTRSYTLLPDMPSEAVLARLLQPAPAVEGPAAPLLPLPDSIVAMARSEPRMPAARVIPVVARAPAAPRPRVAGVFRAALPAAATPRLRLEAIEADASALLRVSAHLAEPAGDAGRRASAAALWQALSATPEDLVRSGAALQKLEVEVAHLRLAAGQTRAEIAGLRRRLDDARPWYLSPRAAQAMGLLVLLAAGAGVLWMRRAQRQALASPWYSAGEGGRSEPPLQPREAAAEGAAQPAPEPAGAPGATDAIDPARSAFGSAQAVAPGEQEGREQAPAVDLELPQAPPRQPRPAPLASGLLRVETLAATLEEVDFLASMGLHSDATEVLKAYLEDSASPAPVAFFELMRVCDLADDPQAVEAVRRRYAKVFGLPAPRLEQVTDPAGLEGYPALGERVVAHWGRGDVLPVIEQALFERPADQPPVSVQAARDLISLYDVAMLLAAQDEAAAGAGAAHGHPLAPWAHAEHPHEAHALAQAATDDFSGQRVAVDIDLSVAPPPLPEQPAQPDPQQLAARLLAEREAARQAAARAAAEAEDAFSAAVAFERAPTRF